MQEPRAIVIVRPAAEIATKKNRTRGRFQQTLKNNIEEALARRRLAPLVTLEHGRFFVEVDDASEAASVLARIFGVASVSPVLAQGPSELGAIVERGHALFAPLVRGRRYAVRARRQGRHGFSSLDVEQGLGFALDGPARVDLSSPEITAHVEVLGERTFFFSDKLPGPGGLPSGVQGRALVMLSGGFDSAVAAWRIMKRGVTVDFLLLNLAGRAHERMVVAVARLLAEAWGAGLRPRLYVIDFEEAVAAIRRDTRSQYWQVVLKRLMYRAAQRIAAESGAEALVTGESIGQVSSQTLTNLAAIDAAAEIPVLRPLIGHDKTEIMAEARRIGTAPLSEHVQEHCAITASFTVTATTRAKIDRQEARLDPAVVERAVAARRVIDLALVTRAESRETYLFVSEIPEGAVVIDCQPPHLYRAWHVPGAEHHDPGELLDGLHRLDKQRTYVVYCTHGTQAAYLAELMQRSGYDAYAFDGGAGRLRRTLSP
jgi:thiamine biosynthesis protein ThiI